MRGESHKMLEEMERAEKRYESRSDPQNKASLEDIIKHIRGRSKDIASFLEKRNSQILMLYFEKKEPGSRLDGLRRLLSRLDKK